MALLDELAVQSFCYRKFKQHDEVIQALKDNELDKIELCGVHINPLADHDLAQTIAKYRDNGIAITAFGVHTFDSNEDNARKIFEFADMAGFDTITCHFAPGSLDIVEKLCEEYGKKAALHNHGRGHEHGSVRAIKDLLQVASKNIGLCLDTAWMLDMRQNPVEVAKTFRDRLMGVHLKDFIFDRAGLPEDVMLGTGNLDLKALLQYLVDTDYDGLLTLEYEGDVDNPVPSIQRCVDIVRSTFAELGK